MVASSNFDFSIIVATEGYTIAENRIYCAVQAIKNECDYLLFIDDDMTFPPDLIDRLLAHKKDVVGVVYHSRNLKTNTTVVLEDGQVLHSGNIPKEMMKCQHVGTGIMLIKTDVFGKIEEPWFKFLTYPNGVTLMGEDAYFCKQAREKGIEIWCDPTLEIGHIGDYIY